MTVTKRDTGTRAKLLSSTILGMCAGPLLAAATPASAQQTPPAPQADVTGQPVAADAQGLQDIVVTAQRRTQSLQEVPISVVAVGPVQITKFAVQTIEQLNRMIPNVSIEHVGLFPGAAALSIRGVGYAGIESFGDPDVAVYVNGVYQSRNAAALSSTIDVESVELLRGPQGTLYGRNAYAGAIALRTNRPDMKDVSASAAVTIGNYGLVDIDVIGNLPISEDKVSARLAVRSHHLDGYYHNNGIVDAAGTVDQTLKGQSVGRENELYVRPTLRLTPDDRWDIDFFGEYYRRRNQAGPVNHITGGTTLASAGYRGFNPFGDPSRGIPSDGSDPFAVGYSLSGRPSDIDQYSISNETSFKTDIGTFRGIFNYTNASSEIWTDTDGENINAYSSVRYENYHSFSAELQFISDFSDRLNMVGGASFLQDRYQTTQLTFTSLAPPFPAVFSLTATPNPAYINNSGRRQAAAVYAQFEYKLTDRLSAVLGGRYSYERKYDSVGENSTLTAAGFNAATFDPRSHVFTSNASLLFGPIADSWHNFAPRVGLNYKLSSDLFLFASWQRAYKSGGFNAGTSDRFAFNTPYGEEKVDSFEGGVKSEWFDRKLRANLNIFYGKYTGLQRTLPIPSPTAASGVTTVTTNVANLRSYGAELELSARPVPSLTLFSNIGYDKAKYTSYCADLDGVETTPVPASGRPICGPIQTVVIAAGTRYLVPNDYSDLKPLRAPVWDITAGFTKDFDLDRSGMLSFTGQLNYRSGLYTELLNSPLSYRPGSVVLDLSLSWVPRGDRFKINAWVRNLTNRVDILSFLAVSTLFTTANPTNPRTFGVTLSAKL